MKNFLLCLTAVAALCPATACLHAQSVQNGSFENPAASNGYYVVGSGDDWTAGGSSVFIYTNNFSQGTTPYGTQWLLFNPNSTDSQQITGTFTLGRVYTLSLVASDVAGNTGDQLTIAVSGGATASQSFTVPARPGGSSAGPLAFATYSLSFTPTTSTPVTLALNNSGSAYFAVDNVQLLVPEPSTWAMLGLGTVGAGAVALRRRRASA